MPDEPGLDGGNYSFIEIDKLRNELFISRINGKHIWRFNIDTLAVNKIAVPKNDEISLNISSLYFDSGRLWIGLEHSNSLLSYSLNEDKFETFKAPDWLLSVRFIQRHPKDKQLVLLVDKVNNNNNATGEVIFEQRIAYFDFEARQFRLTSQSASAFDVDDEGNIIVLEPGNKGQSDNVSRLKLVGREATSVIAELQGERLPISSHQKSPLIKLKTGGFLVSQGLDLARINNSGQLAYYKIPREMITPSRPPVRSDAVPKVDNNTGGDANNIDEIPNNPGVGMMSYDSKGRLWLVLTTFGQLGYIDLSD